MRRNHSGLFRIRRGSNAERVSFRMPSRVVVVGDLNGDDASLALILRGLELIDERGKWIARDTHLVQLGDIVNRGQAARAAIERLMRLRVQAPKENSNVSVILGNHEAMVTLGNLAWCHPEEFLEFASPAERSHYEMARTRRIYELLERRCVDGRTAPITGALRAWEEENVPGRETYQNALGPEGLFGEFIRSLPVAIRIGPLLCVHGGLTPRFAQMGLQALDEHVQETWMRVPLTALDLSPEDAILAEDGPLWSRDCCADTSQETRRLVERALQITETTTMVVGHTRTDLIGGQKGRPRVMHGGRLVCADVGIGSGGSPAAVVYEDNDIWGWYPDEGKVRLCEIPGPVLTP